MPRKGGGRRAPLGAWTPLALLLAAAAAAVLAPPAAAVATRPALPQTFIKVERSSFPTFQGSCAKATRTLQVGPTRRFKSIQAAIDAANPGTKIRVAAGRYAENIGMYYALEVAKDDICIQGAGPGRTVVVGGQGWDGALQKYGVMVSGSRVVLQGLSVVNFTALVSMGRSDGKTQKEVVIRQFEGVGRPGEPYVDGIVSYADTRGAGVPAHDGLLLSEVSVRGVTMGVSCNAGPCHHWMLDRVNVQAVDPGDGGSGADAFAIEEGRQIVVLDSTFSGAGADGIDTKATDVLVARSKVLNVSRNGIKSWGGVDVQDCLVNGTGADTQLAGDRGARYRYLRSTFTRHNWPDGRSYWGVWAYESADAVLDMEFTSCIFKDGPQGGGLYFPGTQGSRLRVTNCTFYDRGAKLLEWGDVTLYTDEGGLAELEARGWGSNNRMG